MFVMNKLIGIGCSILGIITAILGFAFDSTSYCGMGIMIFVGALSLTIYLHFTIANVYIIDKEFCELQYSKKKTAFKISELNIGDVISTGRGVLEVSLNGKMYKINFSEENYNILCILINKCKSSNVTYEDIIKLKEKSIWLWN